MKKIIIYLFICGLFSGISIEALSEEIWRDGKLYKDEEYDKLKLEEEAKVKAAAEEFAMLLLMQDDEEMLEHSVYSGFQLDKKHRISSLINSYHNVGGFSCSGIEVISARIQEDTRLEKAKVGVRIHFTTVDAIGGLSKAPIVRAWDFVLEDEEWLYVLDK